MCFRSAGIEIPYALTLFIFFMAKIPTFIPLTFAGLGVLEGSGAYLFGLLGYNTADVLAGLFLSRIVVVCSVILILIAGAVNYRKLIVLRNSG
jgi:uncharacterized membrane protein YbhN (UPF0104 family)